MLCTHGSLLLSGGLDHFELMSCLKVYVLLLPEPPDVCSITYHVKKLLVSLDDQALLLGAVAYAMPFVSFHDVLMSLKLAADYIPPVVWSNSLFSQFAQLLLVPLASFTGSLCISSSMMRILVVWLIYLSLFCLFSCTLSVSLSVLWSFIQALRSIAYTLHLLLCVFNTEINQYTTDT